MNTSMAFSMNLHHAFNWKMNSEFSKQIATHTEKCITFYSSYSQLWSYYVNVYVCVQTRHFHQLSYKQCFLSIDWGDKILCSRAGFLFPFVPQSPGHSQTAENTAKCLQSGSGCMRWSRGGAGLSPVHSCLFPEYSCRQREKKVLPRPEKQNPAASQSSVRSRVVALWAVGSLSYFR